MSGIIVGQGQERFINAINGYEDSTNKLEYITGQNTNGQKRAMDAVVYGTYPVSTANIIAIGSTQRVIKKATHNARKNDVLQFTSGLASGVAIQILSCPDADTMILASTSEFALAVGDTFDIKRYISPQYDANGALSVVASQGPLIYNLDGAEVEVTRDTITPTNSRPLPVEIMSASGVDINITAGDINVSTSHASDSMRIGDGTTLTVVTANNELKTHDTDSLTKLTSIDGKTPSLGQALAASSVPVVLTAAQIATLTPPAAITGFNLETTQLAISAKLPATLGSKADAASLAVTHSTEDKAIQGALTETAPATDTASSGLNGRLQRIAQRLTSLIALLPTALGQGTMATSFKVVLASDQTAIATKSPVNTAGSTINGSLTATTASLETAPANAVGFILEAPSTNTDNIRYRVGGAASTSAGTLMEPGRDTGYIPFIASISICATVSGTNKYEITWILSA